MARDTNLRPARNDEGYEPAAPAGRNNDPLAELARLIGQEDPFGKLARPGARGPSRAAAEAPQEGHTAPGWASRPAGHEPEYQGSAEQTAYDGDPHYQDDQRYEANDQDGYGPDAYYDDGQGGYGETEAYDEPVPQKRRSGLRTAVTIVGLALISTAGLFGYRAWTSPTTPASEPPIIKAEATPTKVIPAAPSSSSQSSKPIYDRVEDRGGERVVPREEQPIDPKIAMRSVTPATAMMAPPAALPPLPAPPQSPSLAGGEPRKVKTETIRPNQPTSPQPANPPTRGVNIATATPAAVPPAPPPAAAPSTRSITTASIPTRTPAAPAAESGGYVVQVASQRSEADAQASFKALQQKYPGVLGSQHVTVRRADLGEKGVYYRAQIGPFSTAEQAQEMCSSLKSAGGQCLVQRN